MKFLNNSIGMILLAVYLILIGIVGLVPSIAIPGVILSVLALVAGILILLGK